MILGHSAYLTGNWSNILFKLIFSFHMPLFVFFSGFFYTPRPINVSIKSNINSLAVPYFLSSLVSIIIIACVTYPTSPSTVSAIKGMIVGTLGNRNSLVGFWPLQAGPVWFLMSLCICKIVFNWLFVYFRKHIIDLSVCLSVVFYLIGHYLINIPFCIGAGFTFLVFYVSGYKMRELGINSFGSRWILYFIWLFAVYFTKLNTAQYIYTCYPFSVLGAICGSIMLYDICSLAFAEKNPIGKVLSFIGQNTLPILCCHSVAYCTKATIISKLDIDASSIIYDDVVYVILTILFLVLYIMFKYIRTVCQK